MKKYFKTVTEEQIVNMKKVYYNGGKKLKNGDEIIFGFTVNGAAPINYALDEASLTMQIFVLDKELGVIFQLHF